MRVITVRRLKEFWGTHAAAKPLLIAWNELICSNEILDPDELRRLFPQVDYVDGLYVFNVGNSYRLIAAIHFNRQIVYVRFVLTHAQYDRGKWRAK
jgi:mRNA interferase HigB